MSSPPSLFSKYLFPLYNHIRLNNETFYAPLTLFILEVYPRLVENNLDN